MSLQLMNEISDNYHVALAVHRELADVFWFIGMQGYAMLHEYQYIDESMTQRKIKRYITSTYHTFVPDILPKSAKIAEPLLSGKKRKQLKTEDNWKITQESFRIYCEWEESALQEYQRIAKELVESGSISAFNFVGGIIKDVKAELDYVTDLIIGLNAMEWDLPTIIDQQDTYVERYEYKIRTLLGKSRQYHHYNSNVDAESRMSLLDKYPD